MPMPLSGTKIIEFAGLAPVTLAGAILVDMGAEVICIDPVVPLREDNFGAPEQDWCRRGRRSIAIDLKAERGRDLALGLVESSDGVLEGFRPGVMERLGLGPSECLKRNGDLAFVRLTGWGQSGPLAQVPGHDLTYLAISGVLGHTAPAEHPPFPTLNYVADFGAGSMFAVVGMLGAILQARAGGGGQVVDCAMVDGLALFSDHTKDLHRNGVIDFERRGSGLLDAGAPFNRTYETADHRFLAVAAIEPGFYEAFVRTLDLPWSEWADQWLTAEWAARSERLSRIFGTRPLDEWLTTFSETESCVAPVLNFDEAAIHPHHIARRTHRDVDGVLRAGPAPRFGVDVPPIPGEAARRGEHTLEILAEVGMDAIESTRLQELGIVATT